MNLVQDMVDIIAYGTNDSPRKIQAILEDGESPIAKKSVETLYRHTIDKDHVDFGDIPKSKGDIMNYAGYKSMMDVLGALKSLAQEDKAYQGINIHISTVSKAISYISQNRNYYTQAFQKKIEIVELEYNAFVYACVEAVTSLLYQFSDFMKTPSSAVIQPIIKDTKYRADLFYIEQLKKFNMLNDSGKYQKYLAEMIKGGKENFVASTAFLIGAAAIVTTTLVSIVPVTRAIIFSIQDVKQKLADCLTLQAYFLEQHKLYLEAHGVERKPEKTKEIIKKQEKLRLQFLRLAEKLRVKSLKSEQLAKKNIEEENKTITLDSLKDDVENDDIAVF